jgi:hypothetical protein
MLIGKENKETKEDNALRFSHNVYLLSAGITRR